MIATKKNLGQKQDIFHESLKIHSSLCHAAMGPETYGFSQRFPCCLVLAEFGQWGASADLM